jgi:hypothetical protein
MDPNLGSIALVVSQLAMGFSLAASAGLRAFLPLFVVGVAGRLDWIPLTPRFEWLADNPALIVFGIAVVAELLADKVPFFDNFLDLFQSFTKPVAGVIASAAVVSELSPLQTAVLAIVLGGGVATGVHLAKSKVRLLSTAATAGFGNPVLSSAEEVGAWSVAWAALFIPLVTAFTILLLIFFCFRWARRRLRRKPLTGVHPEVLG